MSDCIRVTEVEMDGCPRDTGSFLVETTEKIYVFAADRSQLDDWTHKLCEIAFPVGTHTHTHNLTLRARVQDDSQLLPLQNSAQKLLIS